MNRTRLVAAIVVALAPVALPAAPVPVGAKPVAEVHPFKDARVGDFATYKMTIRIKDQFIHGAMSLTITARTDKEITIESAVSINGNPGASSRSEHKIDVAKAFDPTTLLKEPEAGIKFEKGKTGTEALVIADKEHDAVWTSYRITRKTDVLEQQQELKLWRAKTVPGCFVKIEVICLDDSNMSSTLELTETGRKK